MRAVIGLLACVAIWPAVHRAWVAHSGVSPWKFYGWAMYCEPRFRSQLEFRAVDAASAPSAATMEEGSPLRYPSWRLDARRAMVAYRSDELAWVRQTDASGLARAVFAAYPGVQHLALRRHWWRYDVDKAMPITTTEVLFFARDAESDSSR